MCFGACYSTWFSALLRPPDFRRCLWCRWCSGRRVCFVGPGCLVCPWAAARPRAVRAARCCWWPHWCSGRRRARPPARSPHASFARSGRSRSPPVPSGPSGALHASGACVADVWFGASSRSLARPRRPRGGLQSGGSCVAALTLPPPSDPASPISHAIPLLLFQDLNCDRWNCNVSGLC